MADFNDALQAFLQQMQQQGSTGPASANLSLAQAGRTPNDGTPSGISLLQPQVNTATPQQPQPQPFAPSQAQNQGQAGAAGAQMPPGIFQALIQKLLGMQPQGQQVTTQGGLGQIAPDWRPAQ